MYRSIAQPPNIAATALTREMLFTWAACVAALEKLLASGFLKPAERIVIYNTGAGLKYLEAYATRFARMGSGEQDKLGGLITPR